jgi:hypothetical protein
MERFAREAVLLKLLETMHANNSWCGETHVQKCAYFLKEGLRVPLDLEFILYKHGPFSFDLREVLGEMRGNYLIDVESHPPYGASLIVSQSGRSLIERFPKTTERYEEQIDFVAEQISRHSVSELERLGTALYVKLESPRVPISDRAQRITELKPHVSPEQADLAVKEVDALLEQAPIWRDPIVAERR